MDAHVFRRLAAELTPLLTGAAVSKIYNLSAHTLLLVLASPAASQKLYLIFHYGRDNPAIFLVPAKPVTPEHPDAPVMRLRKYIQGKRIRKVFCNWVNRSLALDFSGLQNTLFLTLELTPPPARPGAGLHPVLPPDFAQDPVWPDPCAVGTLADEIWRDYPVLTPMLRKTLPLIEPREQAALLVDLQAGAGDLFVYEERQPAVNETRASPPQLTAWPLPEALRAGRIEQVFESALAAAGYCYAAEAMNSHNLPAEAQARQTEARQRKRLRRLEGKLEAEEAKLREWCAKKEDALLLQANLHVWPKNHKAESVTVAGPQGDRAIELDPLSTVQENMERFFHLAARGKRGLAHLAERRAALQTERHKPALGRQAENNAKNQGHTPSKDARHKNISFFTTSQGFTVMRGRNAEGNQALLKLAANHDFWLHAKDGPSAHSILRRDHALAEVPEESLLEAAGLTALKSAWKNDSKAEIMLALVRDVRPVKGGRPGAVFVDKVQAVLTVIPDPALETRLAQA